MEKKQIEYDIHKYHRIFKNQGFQDKSIKQFLIMGDNDDICFYNFISEYYNTSESIFHYLKDELKCDIIITYRISSGAEIYYASEEAKAHIDKSSEIKAKGNYFTSLEKERRHFSEQIRVLQDKLKSDITKPEYSRENFIINLNKDYIKIENDLELKWGIILLDPDLFFRSIQNSGELEINIQILADWRTAPNIHSFLLMRHDSLEDTLPEMFQKSASGFDVINISSSDDPRPDTTEIEYFLVKEGVEYVNDKVILEFRGKSLGSIKAMINSFNARNFENEPLTVKDARLLISPNIQNDWDNVTPSDLNRIFRELHEEIIGQKEAKEAWKRNMSFIPERIKKKLEDPDPSKKPLATMFFAGPPGVGKTEFYRFMKKKFESYKIRFKQLDMDKYIQKEDLYRLWGAHESFRGSPEGELGSFLLKNPYSVILFDEFDRAHESILESFLTLLEGNMRTGNNKNVDLSNCIFLFTSNIGHERILQPDEQNRARDIQHYRNIISEELNKKSGCEPLISRLKDYIIPFFPLTETEIKNVIELRLKSLLNKIQKQSPVIEFDKNIQDFFFRQYLNEKKLQSNTGARSVVQSIEDKLEKRLYELKNKNGDLVYISKEHTAEIGTKGSIDDLLEIDEHTFDSSNPWLKFLIEKRENLLKEWREKIVDQEHAFDAINLYFGSILYGLKNHETLPPLGYVFLAGPTGVGKTETFRILQKNLPEEIKTHRFEMTHYKSDVDINRLIGPPPGFVGFKENPKGELGTLLYNHKSCVILFDEFEKAHPSIWEAFLNILDDGSLTCGDGTKLDMSQTFLIFTSNAASNKLKPIPENESKENKKRIYKENLNEVSSALERKSQRPEFVSRLKDNIVLYSHISEERMKEIIKGRVELLAKKYSCSIIESTIERITQEIIEDQKYGMRQLNSKIRNFETRLRSKLAELEDSENRVINLYEDDD